MTNILQISDTHITSNGTFVSERLDTDERLKSLVERLLKIRSEIGVVDAVIISGDLSDDGSAESYQRFKKIMSALNLPLYVIPGNHDGREAMREAFYSDGYFPKDGKLNWHQPMGEIHLIGLDTLIDSSEGGKLDAATLTFLDDTLNKIDAAPVLLALHHQPFTTGIRFMDDIGIQSGCDDLGKVLANYGGEVRVICGHIHSIMVASIGGQTALSAPSPCSSFAFNVQETAPAGFMDAGDGCFLHRWDSGFQSIRLGAILGDGPFPF
ncbi:phosphodiesterase [Rhodobacteraceae bacterium nBUS_24]